MYLRSSNIQLRAPELGDLDYLIHVENDTRLWAVSACKVPYSRYRMQQYIEGNANDIYADRQLRLMAELHADGQLAGIVDLFDFSPADRKAEMGMVVDPRHRGKGYGREMLDLLCQYAENVLDLHQLYVYIFEDNTSARNLFSSSGFQLTAILPDWVFSEKKFRSVCLYQRIFEK